MSFRKTKFTVKDKAGRIQSMWTPKLKEKARALYVDQGMTLRKVAKAIGCSLGAVQLLMNENEWMRTKFATDLSEKDADKFWSKVRRMYVKENVSIPNIAKILAAPASFVMKGLKDQGLFDVKLSMVNSYWSNPGRPQYQRSKGKWDKRFTIPNTYEEYACLVRDLSSIVWRYYSIKTSDYEKVKKGEYAADHNYSVRDGWWKWSKTKRKYVKRKKVQPPWFVAHPANIQIVNWEDNIRKGGTSYITSAELHSLIEKWEKKHGKIFEQEYKDLCRVR